MISFYMFGGEGGREGGKKYQEPEIHTPLLMQLKPRVTNWNDIKTFFHMWEGGEKH